MDAHRIAQKQPLRINDAFKLSKYEKCRFGSGSLRVESASDIVIGASAVIDANECGMSTAMSSFERGLLSVAEAKDGGVSVAKYGYFIGDEKESETAESSQGAGGGVICLVSRGSVRIDDGGVLSSDGSEGGSFGGGSVCVVCDGEFVNNGTISSAPNGTVTVICAKFTNNGRIEPTPTVVLRNADSAQTTEIQICRPWEHRMEKEIELKVSKYRGHWNGHPRNLLDGKGAETQYSSEYGESPIGDWIEFVMREDAVIIPIKIRIRNYGYRGQDIKVISLLIGTENGSWLKLVDDVKDIQMQNETEQEFVFGELLVTPQWIWENNAKHIRMEVRKNYGNMSFTASVCLE